VGNSAVRLWRKRQRCDRREIIDNCHINKDFAMVVAAGYRDYAFEEMERSSSWLKTVLSSEQNLVGLAKISFLLWMTSSQFDIQVWERSSTE
jgi:hypothetical protein